MTDRAFPQGPVTEDTGEIAIIGPTASGKSAVALDVADRLVEMGRSAEIVSIDSMQVYRGMDIGTAKPTAQERARHRHHLLDLVGPDEDFTVAQFQEAFHQAIAGIQARGADAILVGGTGLHLRAAIDDLNLPGQYGDVRHELELVEDTAALHRRLEQIDPVAASRMEPTNRRRVIRALEVCLGSGKPFSSYGPGLGDYPYTRYRLAGLRWPRDLLDDRIAARFEKQIEAGLLEEVRVLASREGGISKTAGQALGYKELLAHVRGETTEREAIDLAITRTRRFARRQERWFRRDPRIEWYDVTCGAELGDIAPELVP